MTIVSRTEKKPVQSRDAAVPRCLHRLTSAWYFVVVTYLFLDARRCGGDVSDERDVIGGDVTRCSAAGRQRQHLKRGAAAAAAVESSGQLSTVHRHSLRAIASRYEVYL